MIGGAVLIIGLGVLLGVVYAKIPKTAYVELSGIYNDFEMKKEREIQLTKVQQARQAILDSLELQLSVMSRSLQGAYDERKVENEQVQAYQGLQQEYLRKKNAFEQENRATVARYEEEIWKQINQYIKDYGKQNDYSYILGADGSGAVMYANEGDNITDEIKRYINERYRGGSK